MTAVQPPTTASPAPPRARRRSPLTWVLGGVALVLVVLVAYVGSVSARVWWTARQDDRGPADAIVVLGASQLDGTPAPVLKARLDHAYTLYEAGAAPVIVTTGSKQPGDRFTEAAAGKSYLVAKGVPSKDVVAVPEGKDTLQSLTAVDAVFGAKGWTSAVVVSDPWHSFRSRTMARDLGIDAVTSPTRSGPSVATRGVEVRAITRETAAYLYYRFAGGGGGGAAPR